MNTAIPAALSVDIAPHENALSSMTAIHSEAVMRVVKAAITLRRAREAAGHRTPIRPAAWSDLDQALDALTLVGAESVFGPAANLTAPSARSPRPLPAPLRALSEAGTKP